MRVAPFFRVPSLFSLFLPHLDIIFDRMQLQPKSDEYDKSINKVKDNLEQLKSNLVYKKAFLFVAICK
jgi:hypothetical protein